MELLAWELRLSNAVTWELQSFCPLLATANTSPLKVQIIWQPGQQEKLMQIPDKLQLNF